MQTCYIESMPKQVILNKPKRTVPLPMKVAAEEREEILKLCEKFDRPIGYIARELMLRGLAAYHRDGQIKETGAAKSPSSVKTDPRKGDTASNRGGKKKSA